MEVFADTFVPAGLHEVLVRRCPRCVWPVLRHVRSFDHWHLLCESCGHCWQVEHGNLRPVNVLGCQGCAARAKATCVTLLREEFPRFGVEPSDAVTV